MELGQGVYALCRERKHALLENMLQTNPQLDVDAWRSPDFPDWTALMLMSFCGYTEMADLLLRHKADVSSIAAEGAASSSLSLALITSRHPDTVDALLHAGADVTSVSFHTAFNADNKKVAFMQLTCGVPMPFIEMRRHRRIFASDEQYSFYVKYEGTHQYIDDYHRILKHTLTALAPVDRRLGVAGIYHEPLERALEYLGLSMSADQVVNTSIDDQGRTHALIPGNQASAKLWYEKYTAQQSI
jgi:hypothetical protein